MAFLDKLSDIGKSVAQKSGELVETGKISMDIKKKERDAKTLKFELGKYIYQQFKSGQEIDDKVRTICSEIDVVYAEIASLEKEKDAVGAANVDDIEVVDAGVYNSDDINAIIEEIDIVLQHVQERTNLAEVSVLFV